MSKKSKKLNKIKMSKKSKKLNKINLDVKEMVNAKGEPTQAFYNKEFTCTKAKHYYAIKDNLSNKFMKLDEQTNDAYALKNFEILVNRKGCIIGEFPQEFEMWHMGLFDEESGEYKEEKRCIAKGQDYVREVNQNNATIPNILAQRN